MRFIDKKPLLLPTKSHQEGQPISRIANLPLTPLNHAYAYSIELQQFLSGKELLADELHFPIETLQEHIKNGFISLNHGLVKEDDKFKCNRCSNQDKNLIASFRCARCGEDCHYCRKCIMMGRVSECTPLFRWVGPETERTTTSKRILAWNGRLSKGQQQASEKVVQAIEKGDELLVWAVCGAGKTEVLFNGIEQGLQTNRKICIATPRTDVVLELAPRLKKVFPTIEIAALYGGSEEKSNQASLYISTTHQLLRFKEAFDTMIIDEVDAFPYSYDESLKYAVRKARKPQSSLIYLSATPSKQWKKEVEQKKRTAVKIPARFHGHPLPVPSYTWCGDWKKRVNQGALPNILLNWINEHLTAKKQAFLFIPSILVLEKVVGICKNQDIKIEGVHSEDPDRKDKVQRFREGKIPILITTTILERGVTISNCDVGILGAEDDIFTESALVQISGRVGRDALFPTGRIIYFHYGKTKAMVEAKKHIEKMNEIAKEGAFLTN
ncbi:DEAD/DEAH box helicase [Metabacillus herbersteinensis]|uniref:DEAD/DEAH box helicase n=1 Tax=Metabacillus herbersteinensis TaxID=283816 RepID=A0ABV6GEW2_9BACI